MLKGLVISVPGGFGSVGEEGSIVADKRSLDLVRVESRATEIPPSLPLQEMTTNVSYARTRIGEHDILLAQQADIDLSEPDGLEDFDRFEFTHCRAYSAESEIRFDTSTSEPHEGAPPESSAVLPVAAPMSKSLPALLAVTVQLATSISDKDMVGGLIEGRVSGGVVRRGKVLIPEASVVRGRIRRLERSDTGKDFIVGLEFTEIEADGQTLPFYADLLRIDKNPLIRATLSERVFVRRTRGMQIDDSVIIRELPGVASFFISGETFTIPAGFRTTWRTRGPIR